jgi:Ser/Thr protein kinase RdoA (MazF antagonist)
VGTQGNIRRMAHIGDASTIFLRLETARGQTFFLKVLSPERSKSLSSAEDLAQWLHDAAISVVVATKRAYKLSDGRQVWGYPFHEGRPPNANVSDMTMIGRALGKLHGVLNQHHLIDSWKRNTDSRIQRLMKTREAVAQGALCAGPDPQGFRRISNDQSIELHPDMFVELGPRVPVHGDLNRFNMLMDENGCTFLDFEDVQQSVFPAIFDIVTVIERVVLVSQDFEVHETCINAFLEAYRAERPDVNLNGWMRALPDIQRSIALRSLCTLAESDPSGVHFEEWSKFFAINSMAEAVITRSASEEEERNW